MSTKFCYLPLFLFGCTIASSIRNIHENQNQIKNVKYDCLSEQTNVCNVTIQGGVLGTPWSVCKEIPSNSQRLQISYGVEKKSVQCTKLNGDWIAYPNKNQEVHVKCPDKNNQTMCLTVFNGRKDDTGYINFDISENESGKRTELCSGYLVLKYKDFPMIITSKIDLEDRELSLISDVIETAEFNASAFFENVFLCRLHVKEECDVRGQIYSHGCLSCNVTDDVLKTVWKMYGNNAEYPVTVIYNFPCGNTKTRTQQKLKIWNSSTDTDEENGLGTGEVYGICFAILVIALLVALAIICLFKYTRVAHVQYYQAILFESVTLRYFPCTRSCNCTRRLSEVQVAI